jgi:hypothetical protein
VIFSTWKATLGGCKKYDSFYVFVSFLYTFVNFKDILYLSSIVKCTTSYFEGTIALIEPQGSWVAKWQRIGTIFRSMPLFIALI